MQCVSVVWWQDGSVQTEFHALSLEAPRDVRYRQATDDALDERVAKPPRVLRTHSTVERYPL